MTISAKSIEELRQRRGAIVRGGGDDKQQQRRARGLLAARDRLALLFQEHTFQEVGMHARHNSRALDLDGRELPADGVVTGTGYVNGQLVAAFSQDFTVSAGTLGKMHADKIVELMDFAIKSGIPLVAFKDSGGARIQEGVDALSG